ncbi:hypothetical protein FHT40_000524 [Mycolicibacterium sp. BK556]|nr:hypothetical protein [Mycolicibacterium sp. BK556]MBB3630645.1 hypothetical protein [Mycolicibacterium sp. BK607]MBB3748639.1 hypothetical protein [Mycolicibacterium sp. BK634]
MTRRIGTWSAVLLAALVATRAYRHHRRRQLILMPKGINTANGVTMRGAMKAARPTSVGRARSAG